MKTVTQIAALTGCSVRTLHHYDAIGLLKPTQVTEAGYRLYDDQALEKLYLILIFRELGFPLKDIQGILDAGDFDRNRVLERQIALLEGKRIHLQNLITFASGLKLTGVRHLKFENFDLKKLDEYAAQAKTLYGKTEAYRQAEEKSRGRTKEQESALGGDMMALFKELGTLRESGADSEAVQSWVAKLRSFITEHYYDCTVPILRGLGDLYAEGGSMTENIEKFGGEGIGIFAREAIIAYCGQQKD